MIVIKFLSKEYSLAPMSVSDVFTQSIQNKIVINKVVTP